MSYRTIISIAAAAILGIACVSTEALAYRGTVRAGGVHVGGGYRAALIAEPTCTAAWVWALGPLPSVQQ
jgi:hypothetical protein